MNASTIPNDGAPVTRRSFLKTTSSAVAGATAALNLPFVLTSHAAPDDPINAAVVGLGGRGSGAARDFLNAGKALNAANPNVRIVALADIFPEAVSRARKQHPDVPEEACFSGFDACQEALAVPGVNYVILATPPGFRSVHFKAAIQAGKNVFMEKPVAVDGPGCRTMFEFGKVADDKGLSVAAGTQRRHQATYIDTVKRLQDGAIGEILCLRAYWNGGAIWHRGWKEGVSEMENEIRNWYHYLWLCGDHIVEQHVHNLDVCNWVMNSSPIRANGMGGRAALGDTTGHKWDHFSVEYEYPNGVRMFSQCRQINGCDGRVSEAVVGTKGTSNPSNAYTLNDGTKWQSSAKGLGPTTQEHADLITAIRTGQRLNETNNVTESTLTAILGRESAYSGRILERDDVLASTTVLMPEKLEWGPRPKPVVPVPGKYKLV